MLNNNERKNPDNFSKVKMALAVILSVMMIVAMAPDMSPVAMFADENSAAADGATAEGAATEGAVTEGSAAEGADAPEAGAGQPVPEGGQGGEGAEAGQDSQESAPSPDDPEDPSDIAAPVDGENPAPAEAPVESEEADEIPAVRMLGISTMALGDASVSTWDELIAAINDPSVTRILVTAPLTRTTNLPFITRTLEIDGQGNTLDFGSSTLSSNSMTLGAQTSPVSLTLRNIIVNKRGSNPLVRAENVAASAYWTVNFDGVACASGTVSALIDSDNGVVNFSGVNNWTIAATHNIIDKVRTINFIGGETTLSSYRRAISTDIADSSINVSGGANVTLYARDNQALWMHSSGDPTPVARAGSMRVNVTEASSLDISGYGSGTGEDGATATLVAYSGGFTVSGGSKLNIRSLSATGSNNSGQPALIQQITNGEFNVSGRDTEMNLISFGNDNRVGATIRFRYGGGQMFNVSDHAVVNITKAERTHTSDARSAAAIRFGRAVGNEFHVTGGARVNVTNYGNARYYDASASDGDNAAIEYDNSDFVFDVSGAGSIIELKALKGPAVDAANYANGKIRIGEGAIFIAEGCTASSASNVNSAIFKAGSNFEFTCNQPLYYNFVNTRAGGGKVFNILGGTFQSLNSDVAVWGNGTNGRAYDHVEGSPFRSWSLLSYSLGGENFSGSLNANLAGYGDFSSEFNTDAASFGANGMAPYTRVSGNNAAPKIGAIYEATNADKYLRARATVPEGLNFEGRGAWDDEVYATIKVIPREKGAEESFVKGVSLGAEAFYGGESVDGLVRYTVPDGGFLRTGDQYQIVDAWRGDPDPSSTRIHRSDAADIDSSVREVEDVLPPTPPVITDPPSILIKGCASVGGTYVATESAIADNPNAPHNIESTVEIVAALQPGGKGDASLIRAAGGGASEPAGDPDADAVTAQLDPANGAWTFVIPNHVKLNPGDRLYFLAGDATGILNPITPHIVPAPYRDAAYPAVNYVTVADGPTNLSKRVIGADGAATDSVTVSGDKNADVKFRVESQMPADMGSIDNVEIRDVMEAGLQLKGNAYTSTDPANVTAAISGSPSGAPAPKIEWNENNRTVSVLYEKLTAEQKAALQGKTVTVEITANFAADNRGVYQTSVKNGAAVYAMGGKGGEIAESDKPVAKLKGKISGVLFDDLDEDGLNGSGDTPVAGVEVKLYKKGVDGDYADTGRAATTGAIGAYTFLGLDDGAYKVLAPEKAEKVFTERADLAVDDGSHAYDDGFSPELEVNHESDGDNLSWTANAGYADPVLLPPEITFSKYPLVLKQTTYSALLSDDELKAGMAAQDPEDGDILASPAAVGAKGTTVTFAGISGIDSHEIGVYKVGYTATDSHGATVARTRAVVITDGRYEIDVIDDGDDTNDVIIGARNFVISSKSVDGKEPQALAMSYAEAYDGAGDEKAVTWGPDAPAGYVAYTDVESTKAGDYEITWSVDGASKEAATKKIKAIVVKADEVYPGGKNDQYAIAASNFLRNVSQAAAMVSDAATANAKLISAAAVTVHKLIDDTDPGTPQPDPLPDKAARVESDGDSTTGPFRGVANTYGIRYVIDGLPSAHGVTINGVVSNGQLPLLTVSTPDEVALCGVYDTGPTGRYMLGVLAIDPDGNKNGSTESKYHTAIPITEEVKYGTLSGPTGAKIFTEGTPVTTTKAGVYGVDYRVYDEDGNRADAHRVVVVNDGSYEVGNGNILKANSFVTKLDSVTPESALIPQELRVKSEAAAINGSTGNPFDLGNDNVTDTGGYGRNVGEYPVTITAPDPTDTDEDHTISKSVTAKVVDADELDYGPKPADPTDATRYYVYGNHIKLTKSQADAILNEADAAAKEAAMLTALSASAVRAAPDGTITDAAVKVGDYGTFTSSASGKYSVKVKDAGSNASISLNVTISQGNGPEIAATPVPLIMDATSQAGILSDGQIFAGVTVSDVEDTFGAVMEWDELPFYGPQVGVDGGTPQISADKKSVTKVTYVYTDADSNHADVSRAIVVNDGRYKIEDGHIIEANSFIVSRSAAELVKNDPNEQIIEKSDAKAWATDGTPATVRVVNASGYGAYEAESYILTIGIDGSTLTKQIEARVIDDRDPPDGGGQEGENGDRYSIEANNFRINVTDATAWQSETWEAYSDKFLTRANAESYLRATLESTLVKSGNPELESVMKLGADGKPTTVNFNDAGLALGEGDRFLATFRVGQEPGTTVSIVVLVSNATPPVLTVPASKLVPVASAGAVFPQGHPSNTSPSYYQGVHVTDKEDDPAIQYTAVTYSGIVDVTAEGAYKVGYSVTDTDHNTVTRAGMVLVGDFIIRNGYGLIAHDFSKQAGQMDGDEDEVIRESGAYAVDLRQDVTSGGATVPNPKYGESVQVTVKSDGGYYGMKPGTFPVIVAVKDDQRVEFPVTAIVGQGRSPEITFSKYPLVLKQTAYSALLSDDDLKAEMTAYDPDDGDILASPTAVGAKGTTVTFAGISGIDSHEIGVYKVGYTATDSHGNTVARTRAVVITDGRYEIDVIDDGDDTNDVIIGARNFVIASKSVDGKEPQALAMSFAEAYDGAGGKKTVTWGPDAPAGYVAYTDVESTKAGDYEITWSVDGAPPTAKAKKIKAIVVKADEVFPGGKNDQYAIAASNFLRNVSQAAVMVSDASTAEAKLISAAAVTVHKLIDDTDPGTPQPDPLPDKAARVQSDGDAATGSFRGVPNTYGIQYVIDGLPPAHSVTINGVVSNGQLPLLTVPTPDEVALGGVYDTGPNGRYMLGVLAIDPDGNKNGSTNPKDHDPVIITEEVKYGTLSGLDGAKIFSEGTPVTTTKAGVYGVDYRVYDADGNHADARRVVVVNDGSYVVGASNILKASSFVTKLDSVTSESALIRQELRVKSEAAAINGSTGAPFDLSDDDVADTGGYGRNVGEYPVTITAPDPTDTDKSHRISKSVTAKVVDADELDHGPKPADPTDATRYYVYGNHIKLTKSQADAILNKADAAAKETAMLTALSASAIKSSPDGAITGAAVKVADYGTFTSSVIGEHSVKVKDAGGNASVTLKVAVLQGNGPEIAATPVPLVVDATSKAGVLGDGQIFAGVTVSDIEDTLGAAKAWDELPSSGPQVEVDGGTPQINADKKSVTKVTYVYTDADSNPDDVSRAIVVNDGRYMIEDGHIIEANSFIVSRSAAALVKNDPNEQIIEKSDAKAWEADGTPATVRVVNASGYGAYEADSYILTIGIDGSTLTKQIEARVIDDRDPPDGGGQEGGNGDRYSIKANDFRVNVTDATAWQSEKGEAYSDNFLTRANAESYLRATLEPALVKSGTPELESVMKLGADGKPTTVNFNDSGLALGEGDRFLATFRVGQEPGTTVSIVVLVSNATPPVLTVPASKLVPVASAGAVFPQGHPSNTSPSYYQGVHVTDKEDYPAIQYTAVTYSGIVDVTAEGAYKVAYSVTDTDHNTTTRAGMVLVGDFIIRNGYGLIAHDFSKQAGQMDGDEDEVIRESGAYAVDLRQDVTSGGATVPNPKYGESVQVTVKSDGGYYGMKPGTFPVIVAVKDDQRVEFPVTAIVGRGNTPEIKFTEYPLVLKQTTYSALLSDDELKAEMTAYDPDDGDILASPAALGAKGTTVTLAGISGSGIDSHEVGVYKVGYTATDSHGNTVARTRAVVITDGRYEIDVIDDNDDTNDIIIGARSFVIARELVNGSERQAKECSYAEAYDGNGNAKTVTWERRPTGYDEKAAAGDYAFTWQVSGFLTTKSITGHVTDATVVDPGTKDSQYALIAYDFRRTTARALAMLTSGKTIEEELIAAAQAEAVTLVPGAAAASAYVVGNGDALTGPFSTKQNTYPIRFGVRGRDADEFKAIIRGVVSNGYAPVLTVPEYKKVAVGAAFGDAKYMQGVSAADVEYGAIPSDWIGYDRPVDTSAEGVYKVTYSARDDDDNVVTEVGIVLVGDWIVGDGYAISAHDFALPLSQVKGTEAEMLGLANVRAACVDRSHPAFGDAVRAVVQNDGGYSGRKAGSFPIRFAVQTAPGVTKTIIASVSDDTPEKPATITPPPPIVIINPPAQNVIVNTPAPNVVVNTQRPRVVVNTPAPNVIVNPPAPVPAPAPAPAPVPEPVVEEAPAPTPAAPEAPEAATETAERPIEPPQTPTSAPAPRGAWHLIDLLLVIFTMALGFYLMSYAMRRRDEYDAEMVARGHRIRMWGQLGMLLGIISITVLLLTQDFRGDMKAIDAWAVLLALIFGVETLAAIGVTRVRNKEWEEEREV